ncbi:MAG: hypothetical protein O2865_01755 [Planctomycetota bacterium]|nr:hypothetical protein [Planctomycetota bacterium]MDA1220538.1 hypothetical protein [Planctomycetota bacterium]
MRHLPTAMALATQVAFAQWPGQPTPNLPIATGNGDQVVPQIAATSEGGCYIGWFDQRSGSYELRLQRLDAHGVAQWQTDGIVVSSQPQSTSLVGWSLIADRDDHCVLAFTDTRAGGDLDVYAYRIDPSGQGTWGSNGITLSNNADFEANPVVCETSDGDFVFVWPNSGIGTLQMQRLDRQGNPRFPGDGVSIPGDPGAAPAFPRVVAAEQGNAIVSWVRTFTFFGNKHVHAQKFDASGAALWNNGTRIAVFDLASVPIAHEPRLLPDGAGGAILAWHFANSSSLFNARVQHILANGSEAFPHNGVSLSSSSSFDPAIVWLPNSQEILAVFNERNASQSQWGITAQKVDASGQLGFGSTGLTVIPVSATERQYPVAARSLDGLVAFLFEAMPTPTHYRILGFRLSASGSVTTLPTDVSAFPSGKSRIVASSSQSGVAMCAWSDQRVDGGDLYAQNLNPDGSLGDQLADAVPYGCGLNPIGSLLVTGRPAVGTTMTFGVTNPLGTQATGSTAAMLYSLLPAPGFPCGTPIPGLGMAGSGAPGELLLDTSAPLAAQISGPWSGPGQPVTFALRIPDDPTLIGARLYAQGALFDPTPGNAVPVGLTTGVRLDLGT